MGKFRKKNAEKAPPRHEAGVHYYTNSYPISRSRILVAFPNLETDNDFPALLKHMVENLPSDERDEDTDMLLGLYQNAIEANVWNYKAEEEPFWSSDDAALLSLKHLNTRAERFLLYGLTEELWRIEYKDLTFGSRQFVGRIIEINRNEKYLILDSKGIKRRLNMANILGALDYSKHRATDEGTLKYALFSFEEVSTNERKVSWRILPNDRSETLIEALGITDAPKVENKSSVAEQSESSRVTLHESPLPNWKKALGEKASVRVLEEDGFKDYYLVVDHLSWDPRTNIAEIGSKGLTLSSTTENLIVKLL